MERARWSRSIDVSGHQVDSRKRWIMPVPGAIGCHRSIRARGCSQKERDGHRSARVRSKKEREGHHSTRRKRCRTGSVPCFVSACCGNIRFFNCLPTTSHHSEAGISARSRVSIHLATYLWHPPCSSVLEYKKLREERWEHFWWWILYLPCRELALYTTISR